MERKLIDKAFMAERSKAADSRSAGETRVSSNLTECIIFYFIIIVSFSFEYKN